jgi:hypothetical protein
MERISGKQKESNVFSLAGSGANLKTSARRGRDDGTDIGTGTVQGPPMDAPTSSSLLDLWCSR